MNRFYYQFNLPSQRQLHVNHEYILVNMSNDIWAQATCHIIWLALATSCWLEENGLLKIIKSRPDLSPEIDYESEINSFLIRLKAVYYDQ
jgi:hypothetical protein